ncbi:hypothetical protein H0X48_01260 [Candidatus Dependentiae bacterium]|nr:hypothetical protein [Candidatus Dependentiae bacterium]
MKRLLVIILLLSTSHLSLSYKWTLYNNTATDIQIQIIPVKATDRTTTLTIIKGTNKVIDLGNDYTGGALAILNQPTT